MGVRRYRKNIYFAEGKGFPPVGMEPRFKHMGPVVKTIITTTRITYSLIVLETLENKYPRSGRNGRSEIAHRAVQLLAAWMMPGAKSGESGMTLSDQLSEVLEQLEMAITHLTPLYTFYGEHPHNSQYIGVWPDEDQIYESVGSGELVQVQTVLPPNHPDLHDMLESVLAAKQDVPGAANGFSGAVLLVSPHEWQRLYWISEGRVHSLIWHYSTQ